MELTQHPCIGVKEYLTRLRFFILSDSQSETQSFYQTRFGLIVWNFLFSWFIPRDLWTCMVLVVKTSRPNALVEEYPSLRGIDKVLSPQDGNLQAILSLRLVPIVRPFRWNSTTNPMEAPTYHSKTFACGIFLCCHIFETGSQGWEVPVMPRASKKLLCYSQRTETDCCICFPIRKVETWDVVLEESRRRTQDEIDDTIRHRGQFLVAGTCNNLQVCHCQNG